jgi:hypothetical protein
MNKLFVHVGLLKAISRILLGFREVNHPYRRINNCPGLLVCVISAQGM